MLNLNLLPEPQQKNLGYEIDRRMISFFGFWFFLLETLFAVFLFLAYLFVLLPEKDIQRSKNAEEASQLAADVVGKEEKIRNLNHLFEVVIVRGEKSRSIIPFLEELFLLAPEGIFVDTASFHAVEKKADIRGRAVTRDDLLRFAQKIRERSDVADVVSPVENIIKERDIVFTLAISMRL